MARLRIKMDRKTKNAIREFLRPHKKNTRGTIVVEALYHYLRAEPTLAPTPTPAPAPIDANPS